MGARTIRKNKNGATAIAPERVRERIDLDQDWSDVSGDPGSNFQLVDADGRKIPPQGDDERFYVWAHDSNDPESGTGRYKREIPGYEIVRFRADGVRPIGSTADLVEGEPIKVMDHILMSCDRALHDKRDAYLRHKDAIRRRQVDKMREGDVVLSPDVSVARKHRERLGAFMGQEA